MWAEQCHKPLMTWNDRRPTHEHGDDWWMVHGFGITNMFLLGGSLQMNRWMGIPGVFIDGDG